MKKLVSDVIMFIFITLFLVFCITVLMALNVAFVHTECYATFFDLLVDRIINLLPLCGMVFILKQILNYLAPITEKFIPRSVLSFIAKYDNRILAIVLVIVSCYWIYELVYLPLC